MKLLKNPGAFIGTALIAILACGMVFVRTSTSAPIGPTGAVFVLNPSNSADACLAWTTAKLSAVVNISTATTTELVAATSGKSVFLCGFTATLAGTTPSIQFKSGTRVSTPCDTAPSNLSGTFLPTAGNTLALHSSGTVFKSAVSGEICATSGGTPSIQGVISYVVQ